MDSLLKFGELFKNPRENLEILGTKKPSPDSNFCQHCGKVVKRQIVFKDHNTGMFILYGVNHAAEILGYSMNEINKMITKANRVMLLKFMPEYKKNKLYPHLRNARRKADREHFRSLILKDMETPGFFLPDVNAKGS